MSATDLPEHAAANRDYWNAYAPKWVAAGERQWASDAPNWGIWGLPDDGLDLLPADMTGQRAIELGCGTGYGSAWMARRGAEVLGVDVSSEQLATARRLSGEHELEVEWLQASAESVPRPDASFDFAFSEYGAAIWCDPHVWIPEAHRLLRPGGRLVFLGCHPLASLCTPESGSTVEERLHRDLFGMRVLDWREAEVDPGGVEFTLSHGAWFRLFREVGFAVEDYLELRAPAESPASERFSVTWDWARRFPAEQVWKLRKR